MMERLTKRLEDGQAVMDCDACENAGNTCHLYQCRNRLKDRLAAYEDTGLEPEEIGDFINRRERAVEIAGYVKDTDADHINALLQAEKDSRLVVLPCKVGSTLFRVTRRRNSLIPHLSVITLNKNNFWRIVIDGEFGKTVFATLEDALTEMHKEEES